MMARTPKVKPFWLTSMGGYNIIEFGPRYPQPGASRELVLQVFHRTTDGRVSVLIEPDQVDVLGRWFLGEEVVIHHSGGHRPLGEQPDGSFQEPTEYFREFTVFNHAWTLRDLQTTAEAIRDPDGTVEITISWNGSGRTRSARLSSEDRRAVAGFLTKFHRDGWTARR